MAERWKGILPTWTSIFQGTKVPRQIDTDSPASPVVDLSRLAARGAYFNASSTLNAAVGSNTYGSQVSATIVQSTSGLSALAEPKDLDVWLIEAGLMVDVPANLADAAVFTASDRLPPNGAVRYPIIFRAWVAGNIKDMGFSNPGAPAYNVITPGQGQPSPVLIRPEFSPPGTPYAGVLMRLRAGAGGAVVGTFNLRFWIGPRGATPPGMQ